LPWSGKEVKIEVLYIADCPNSRPTIEVVREVLREQGFPPDIIEIEISDAAQAAALSFLGSPTVRVDGKNVEPSVNLFPSYGVSCRTYFVDGRFEGTPRREWIRNAVLPAKS
jgi:hypothetical protein